MEEVSSLFPLQTSIGGVINEAAAKKDRSINVSSSVLPLAGAELI